jgi:uncharacterized protein YbjQ (UPF0145 family)
MDIIDPKLITTAFTIQGYRIIENRGVVRGITVRSRSIIGSFFANVQTVFGGNISILTELCEQSRMQAYVSMTQNAILFGGNAIIGVRYDANDVMPGVAEVICYGTAVVVESEQ